MTDPDSNPQLPAFDEEPAEAEVPASEVRLAAMDFLARREYSKFELRTRLKRRFADEAVVEEQLERLADEKLQSDARFAENYVRHRVDRGYGPLRLRAELRERGVSDADADRAMEASAVDWCELASTVLRKKYGQEEARDMKDKSRRVRFMQHRGFSSEHYRALLWE